MTPEDYCDKFLIVSGSRGFMSIVDKAYSNIKESKPEFASLLNRGNSEEIGSKLLKTLRNEEDTFLKKDIITVLGDIEYEDAVGTLTRIAQSEDTESTLKRASVNCLKNFSFSDECVYSLLDMIGQNDSPEDKWVRQLATQTLISILRTRSREDDSGIEDILRELREEYLNSDNTFTRMNVVIVLRMLYDKEALPYLKKRLEKERQLMSSEQNSEGVSYIIEELKLAVEKFS